MERPLGSLFASTNSAPRPAVSRPVSVDRRTGPPDTSSHPKAGTQVPHALQRTKTAALGKSKPGTPLRKPTISRGPDLLELIPQFVAREQGNLWQCAVVYALCVKEQFYLQYLGINLIERVPGCPVTLPHVNPGGGGVRTPGRSIGRSPPVLVVSTWKGKALPAQVGLCTVDAPDFASQPTTFNR